MRERILCYALRYHGEWNKIAKAIGRDEEWSPCACAYDFVTLGEPGYPEAFAALRFPPFYGVVNGEREEKDQREQERERRGERGDFRLSARLSEKQHKNLPDRRKKTRCTQNKRTAGVKKRHYPLQALPWQVRMVSSQPCGTHSDHKYFVGISITLSQSVVNRMKMCYNIFTEKRSLQCTSFTHF